MGRHITVVSFGDSGRRNHRLTIESEQTRLPLGKRGRGLGTPDSLKRSTFLKKARQSKTPSTLWCTTGRKQTEPDHLSFKKRRNLLFGG
jgi:hypothetical protein